jgi:hypothetical protein
MSESLVRRIKILISSTRADLFQYREKASEIIKKVAEEKENQVHLIDTSMEKETQSGYRERPVAVSKRWVEEEADWVVVIVGWNYGTITDEDGADHLSVTEWEYKHAIAKEKKVFVFVAGDPGCENQYRALPIEIEKKDLKDWRWGEQNPEQINKIKMFRKHLLDGFVDIFCNLESFCKRLEKTIKKALDGLTALNQTTENAFEPSPPLAELIVEMIPDIRTCIRKVRLISDYKELHDCLHEIRQQTIRPLQEQILPQWTQGKMIEKEIWRCINRALPPMGCFKSVRKSLEPDIFPENEDLCVSIDLVKNCFETWHNELETSDSQMNAGIFSEKLDKFANGVQEAFSEADRNMTREEGELRERYLTLLAGLKRARRQGRLSSSDHRRLDVELEKVKVNRDRVKKSLTIHHNWQEIHDRFYEVDCLRDTDAFDKLLGIQCKFWEMKLPKLVEEELKNAYSGGADCVESWSTIGAGADLQGAADLSPRSRHAFSNFINDLKHLKKRFETLVLGKQVQAFDEMCKSFDDVFYFIDKRTLAEVEGARKRVVELEKWLDELARRHRQTN